MRKSSLRALFAALLALGMCVPPFPVIAVTQGEIDALEAERDALRDRQEDLSEQLGAMQAEHVSVLARKAALDEQSALLWQDITLLDEQIVLYDGIIAEKQAETETARAEEEAQLARYRQRVRAMEEQGRWSYLSFLIGADSLSDLLSRWNDISDILAHDHDLRADYAAARERAEAAEAECEAAQERQREKQTELLERQALLAEQVEAAGRLLAQLEDDIEAYQAFCAAAEAEKERVQALIDEKAAELKKQQEEAERLKNQLPAAGASAGYYAWPANTTWITSPFGPRVHPIYGQLKPHTGVDIGASYGSAVTAAAAGTVTVAMLDYGSVGYGTYVAIYHANGTTTLYGHMSALSVSAGDTVTQGQVIGYVGDTGAATGPHLHFEIRENGVCVDPMQYF